jgi:small basic protein
LASLDSLLGGWRSVQEDKFDGAILLSGFFINAITAMLLVFVGTLLNLPLELAAVIAFGLRIFNNVGYIRRGIVQQLRQRLARKNQSKQEVLPPDNNQEE